MVSIDSDSVTHYLDVFATLREKVGENDAAVVFAELAKTSRLKAMVAERQAMRETNGNGGATAKQLSYLKYLGVNVDLPLSKKEASDLIDEVQVSSVSPGAR